MITITKDITIKIDKGDVPVLSDICEMARHYLVKGGGKWCDEKRIQEIRKFLNIIHERLR